MRLALRVYPRCVQGPTLRLDDVVMRYGDCWSVREASVVFEPGAIHAIVGENGAGKSTLLKIASGFIKPISGSVRVEGAGGAGAVGLVHQHFMLVSAFSALENLVLGAEPMRSFGRLDLARARREAEALMERTGLRVPLDKLAADLAVGERQRLEILRVLYRGARALLLDEPTAVLSPLEAEELYTTLGRLVAEGTSVVVVTHHLDEVIRFARKVTVMRRGRVVLTRDIAPEEGSRLEAELTRAIMGGEPPAEAKAPPLAEDAEAVLELSNVVLVDASGKRALNSASLVVKKGEIVGIAGIEGNGQRELVRVIAGLEPTVQGSLLLRGKTLSREGSVAALVTERRPSIAVVHEDRHAEGLMLDASVGDNLVLGELMAIDGETAERALIKRRIERFGVAPPDAERLAAGLSGGNQQKVVVARALDRIEASPERALVVLGQPTRGVDVGAQATIHRAIVEAASRGLAVLIVSADLSELKRLSHRILVLSSGRIVAELSPSASDDEIGRAMLGVEAA